MSFETVDYSSVIPQLPNVMRMTIVIEILRSTRRVVSIGLQRASLKFCSDFAFPDKKVRYTTIPESGLGLAVKIHLLLTDS